MKKILKTNDNNNILIDLELLEKNKNKTFALRGLSPDEEYEIGDICRNSYEFDEEYMQSSYVTENPVLMDGTCGERLPIDFYDDEINEIIEIIQKRLDNFGYYGQVAIIAGEKIRYGNDPEEVILDSAIVLALEDCSDFK